MSKFHDSYNKSSSNELDGIESMVSLSKKYPEIAEALHGKDKTRDDPKGVPPLTLMFSFRDDRLRWTLSGVESAQGFGGTIKPGEEPLEAVERALLTGEFDRWAKRGK